MAKPTVWGVRAKNVVQGQALAHLMNPEIDLVILEGVAGSGKTLLALAAGLEQVVEQRMYKDIIFTRAAVGVGEDMGFLPGEIGDKMLPWCGALMDNLEALGGDDDVIMAKVKMMALQHMRGRSFNKRYVIIDEVQNLTPQQVKVLITRAGEDCKIICLGDISQIDNRKLNGETNGLTYLSKAAEGVEFIKTVLLEECERSRLAAWAGGNL